MTQAITSLSDRPFAEGCAMTEGHRDASERSDWLSAAMIIGLPLVFWMLMFELAAWVGGFGHGMALRLVLALMLGGFLTLIWGALRNND